MVLNKLLATVCSTHSGSKSISATKASLTAYRAISSSYRVEENCAQSKWFGVEARAIDKNERSAANVKIAFIVIN